MKIIEHIEELRRWRAGIQTPVGLVPTMGGLHEGHMALVEAARQQASQVLVSIYVNPLQFGPSEDLAAYPRSLDADLLRLQGAADAVFIPSDALMYPQGRAGLSVVMPSVVLTKGLCGASRPGHFVGVATVVAKLFNLVQPQYAVFGEKDFQQLQVIRRMVADLDFPIAVLAVPTLREADGLAMSSRNTYLNREQRLLAAQLYATLNALAQRVARDSQEIALLREAACESLQLLGIEVEYLELVRAHDLQAATAFSGELRWCVAARVGKTRLIDNVAL